MDISTHYSDPPWGWDLTRFHRLRFDRFELFLELFLKFCEWVRSPPFPSIVWAYASDREKAPETQPLFMGVVADGDRPGTSTIPTSKVV